MKTATITPQDAISATRNWLRDIVIGLNLCPFAGLPFRKNTIRYQVSHAKTTDALLADLVEALIVLHRADPDDIATTLLIIPYMLQDFADYNDFLTVADATLCELELEGIIQIASFHPKYQFAGCDPDALANFTNRAPYPILHLLREDDVSRAVATHPAIERIPEDNIQRLQSLGEVQIKALLKNCNNLRKCC